MHRISISNIIPNYFLITTLNIILNYLSILKGKNLSKISLSLTMIRIHHALTTYIVRKAIYFSSSLISNLLSGGGRGVADTLEHRDIVNLKPIVSKILNFMIPH